MSEENKASATLNTAVTSLIERLEKAESFVLDQAPDVCKEVIAEKKSLTLFAFTISVSFSVLFVILAISSYICLSPMVEHHDDFSPKSFYTAVFFVLSALPILNSISKFGELLSLRAAPKLTILRELHRLVS